MKRKKVIEPEHNYGLSQSLNGCVPSILAVISLVAFLVGVVGVFVDPIPLSKAVMLLILPPIFFFVFVGATQFLFEENSGGSFPILNPPSVEHSRLIVERAPVPMGTALNGHLELSLSEGEPPPDGFQVQLEALQESGAGQGTSYSAVWSASVTVSGHRTAEGLNVPISFDLPTQIEDLSRVSPFSDDPRPNLKWSLSVSAEFAEGPPYNCSFPLPVVVPEKE